MHRFIHRRLCLFAMHDDDSSSSSRSQEDFLSGREASARSTDMVDDYHDLMMDDEQKFQMALDQANRLSDLLGLVEKKYLLLLGKLKLAQPSIWSFIKSLDCSRKKHWTITNPAQPTR